MKKDSVLVVEDEILVAEELREYLERLGYAVPAVLSSGDEVVEAVARYRPDLLLMDIHVDGSIDGIEAAFQAKAEFGIPVIYLTAYSDDRTLSRAAGTRPAAYLLKPFNERELAVNVAMAISSARSADDSEENLRHNEPLVDAIGAPALLLEPDGRIVYANAAALALLKIYDIGRIRGESVSRFVDLAGGREEECSRVVVAADGTSQSFSVRIEPLFLREGREIGTLVVFDSMSCRERALLESSAVAINETIAALLPPGDVLAPRFATSGFLVPCPSGTGDLVDVIRLSEDMAICYALDVMGHGAFAALVAYSFRDLVRAVAREAEEVGRAEGRRLGAADLLAAVNARYLGRSPGTRAVFSTAVLCVIDLEDASFSVARAGHPPAIALRAGQEPEVFFSEGMALGVTEEIALAELSGSLAPGDRLLLLSDGLIEAVGALSSPESLVAETVRFIAERRSLELEEFVAAIREPVLNRDAGDDASLLVIERRS